MLSAAGQFIHQQNTSLLTTDGKIDTALLFNGTTDWVDCGTSSALLPDAWTVCAWVKCTDTATPTLISFGGTWPAVKLQQNGKGKPLIYLKNPLICQIQHKDATLGIIENGLVFPLLQDQVVGEIRDHEGCRNKQHCTDTRTKKVIAGRIPEQDHGSEVEHREEVCDKDPPSPVKVGKEDGRGYVQASDNNR